MAQYSRLKTNFYWGIAIIGYYCWFQAFYNAVRFGDMFYYSDLTDFIIGVASNFIPIFLLFVINLQIVFRLVRLKDEKRKLAVDVTLSFVSTVAVNYAYLLIINLFQKATIDWAGTFLNDILILLGIEMVYYFKRTLRSRQEAEDANKMMLQYKYDALRAQINPHFLFNSLNILYSLVSIDSMKSKVFIRELARMYRYVMAQQNREIISVREELEYLSSYVLVLSMRYNSKFLVEISGETDLDRNMIPFTMQLLIENVIKHNVISSSNPMKVAIMIDKDMIVVSNPYQPRVSETVSHFGLNYLSQLYEARGYRFYTENDGKTFKAFIPLLSSDTL